MDLNYNNIKNANFMQISEAFIGGTRLEQLGLIRMIITHLKKQNITKFAHLQI